MERNTICEPLGGHDSGGLNRPRRQARKHITGGGGDAEARVFSSGWQWPVLPTTSCVKRRHAAHISKKHFRQGGMAMSEWTCSVRAVRVTPVADYSAPGVQTTHRVTYRPPIAVSPFLLALSVSYLKKHTGVVANCDHTSEWVHWVHACIGIAMQWVTLRKSLLAFLLH